MGSRNGVLGNGNRSRRDFCGPDGAIRSQVLPFPLSCPHAIGAEDDARPNTRSIADLMPIADKIPGFADSELKTLHENARRLEQEGSPAQRRTAAELLPVIDAELATRKAAKAAARKKPRATAA
jgi:hypothetical protein